MKKILLLLLIIATLSAQSQQLEKYNLGFENQTNKGNLPDGWMKWGNYDLTVDSLSHSGKKAGKITSNEAGNTFGSIAYKIPANYTGKAIKLEGYMKINNVENGFAGLLLRIDGNGRALAFDNMQNQNITGTKDWQKYTITLNYPEEAENIFIAGILSGKGEAWFDNFVLTIDGKDIQTLEEVKKELPKAQIDKEFDKGSLIKFPNLTAEKVNNIALLGKVWGFLKYYHPEIAKGNYNWDYELFRFLPKYIEAVNDKQRNDLILKWIGSLGKLKKCLECKPIAENAILKPNLKWIIDK